MVFLYLNRLCARKVSKSTFVSSFSFTFFGCSFEILSGKLLHGRPDLIPSRMPDVCPDVCTEKVWLCPADRFPILTGTFFLPRYVIYYTRINKENERLEEAFI